jgi:hypothetical protein
VFALPAQSVDRAFERDDRRSRVQIDWPRQLFTGSSVARITDRATITKGLTMTTMQEYGRDQHVVRRQRAVHRGSHEQYLANLGSVAPTGERISTRCAETRPTSHAPVIESFIRLARSRRSPARCRCVDDAAGAGAANDRQFRTLGMFRRGRSAGTSREALHRSDRRLRFTEAISTPNSTSARSRPARIGCVCAI